MEKYRYLFTDISKYSNSNYLIQYLLNHLEKCFFSILFSIQQRTSFNVSLSGDLIETLQTFQSSHYISETTKSKIFFLHLSPTLFKTQTDVREKILSRSKCWKLTWQFPSLHATIENFRRCSSLSPVYSLFGCRRFRRFARNRLRRA